MVTYANISPRMMNPRDRAGERRRRRSSVFIWKNCQLKAIYQTGTRTTDWVCCYEFPHKWPTIIWDYKIMQRQYNFSWNHEKWVLIHWAFCRLIHVSGMDLCTQSFLKRFFWNYQLNAKLFWNTSVGEVTCATVRQVEDKWSDVSSWSFEIVDCTLSTQSAT